MAEVGKCLLHVKPTVLDEYTPYTYVSCSSSFVQFYGYDHCFKHDFASSRTMKKYGASMPYSGATIRLSITERDVSLAAVFCRRSCLGRYVMTTITTVWRAQRTLKPSAQRNDKETKLF